MIQSKLTLKQLETFDCVVKAGTFRKAATILGTTQPNVSARISTLEESLGVLLMHRDAGSIRLTDKGQALLVSARTVLSAAENFLATADRQDLIEDRMRLGVTELVASTWLHEFLRQFRAIYPAVAVELEVDLSVEIDQALSAGQIDLGIMTATRRAKVAKSIGLNTYDYAWFCNQRVSSSLAATPDLKSLLEVRIITHAKHTVASKELTAFAKNQGLKIDGIVHSSSLSACLEMALDGMGVALLPSLLARKALEDGNLVRVNFNWTPDPLEFEAQFNAKSAPPFIQRAAELAREVCAAHGQ